MRDVREDCMIILCCSTSDSCEISDGGWRGASFKTGYFAWTSHHSRQEGIVADHRYVLELPHIGPVAPRRKQCVLKLEDHILLTNSLAWTNRLRLPSQLYLVLGPEPASVLEHPSPNHCFRCPTLLVVRHPLLSSLTQSQHRSHLSPAISRPWSATGQSCSGGRLRGELWSRRVDQHLHFKSVAWRLHALTVSDAGTLKGRQIMRGSNAFAPSVLKVAYGDR
jgi:hypothetical protein